MKLPNYSYIKSTDFLENNLTMPSNAVKFCVPSDPTTRFVGTYANEMI